MKKITYKAILLLLLFTISFQYTHANNSIFYTNVGEDINVDIIKSYLFANDNLDGDISSDIYIISDDYTTNKKIVGDHQVVFGIKDSSDNETTFLVNVRVVDITPPVIRGTKDIDIYTGENNKLLENITAFDSYDGDISHNLEINEIDTLSPGSKSLIYSVKDSSGNKTEIEVMVNILEKETQSVDNTYQNYIVSAIGVIIVLVILSINSILSRKSR